MDDYKYIIYGLFDPRDGRLRYVGKSSSGFVRALAHGRASVLAAEAHSHKSRRIRQLQSLGLTYTIEVLEQHDCAEDLPDAERWNIQHYRSMGYDLTNLTDGGEGLIGWRPSPETRTRMAASRTGKQHHIKTRAKIASAHLGRAKHTVKSRRQLSLAHGARPFRDQNGNLYHTHHEASERLGLLRGSVSKVLRGEMRSTGGYHFHYTENT